MKLKNLFVVLGVFSIVNAGYSMEKRVNNLTYDETAKYNSLVNQIQQMGQNGTQIGTEFYNRCYSQNNPATVRVVRRFINRFLECKQHFINFQSLLNKEMGQSKNYTFKGKLYPLKFAAAI